MPRIDSVHGRALVGKGKNTIRLLGFFLTIFFPNLTLPSCRTRAPVAALNPSPSDFFLPIGFFFGLRATTWVVLYTWLAVGLACSPSHISKKAPKHSQMMYIGNGFVVGFGKQVPSK
jgi:hypothetical protein